MARPTRSRKPAELASGVTVAGYVRVSTEEQGISGAGLEAQRAAIQSECTRRGWELLAIFEDVASGKSLIRPGLAQAQAAIAEGQAVALVVAKLDRLSRSVHDFSGLLLRAEREGWGLRILDPDVDTVSPTGTLLAHITSAVAEWERRIIGQRTKAALEVKRAQGVRLGRPPLVTEELRRSIRSAHRHGRSWSEIARRLEARAVPTPTGRGHWFPSSVRQIAKAVKSTREVA
jgi:DNA invertase Pin-like site-specific DNA recombinase